MKQITDSLNVCHNFVHQRQNELTEKQRRARDGFMNNNGSVFSYEDLIFSYGRHFCMGKIYLNAETILITDRSYSNSTAKHLNYLHRASGHLSKIYVKYPESIGYDNFLNFRDKLNTLRDKLARARKPEQYINEIMYELNNLSKYINFIEVYEAENIPGNWQEYKDLLNSFDTEKLQEQAKQYQARMLEKFKQDQAAYFPVLIEYWDQWSQPGANIADELKDQVYKIPENIKAEFNKVTGHKLKLINQGQELEVITSLGIKVPIQEARAGYLLWKAGKLLGYKFAGFSVTSANSAGFVAGCHTLKAEQINKIAKTLNW